MTPVTTGALSANGEGLHRVSWEPSGQPKARIVIAHGLGEHCARYDYVARYLTRHGFAVYGLDYRGHGRSPGWPRGQISSKEDLVSDLALAVDAARGQGGEPLFLIGHSLGSMIGLYYILDRQTDLAGFISSGTPLGLATFPTPLVAMARWLSRLVPNLPVYRLRSKDVCRTQKFARYDEDPLNARSWITVRTASEILSGAKALIPRLGQLTLPLLILHGGADRITPLIGSSLLYERAASVDKTLKIYPDLYHEIFNEQERDSVLDDVVQWISERVVARQPVATA